jgi:DNA-binding beta-propeller fold protein YncE
LLTTLHVGSRPDALALTPAQDHLLVVNSGSSDVAVIRTAVVRDRARDVDVPTLRLLTMVPVGKRPNQIAIKPFMPHQAPE